MNDDDEQEKFKANRRERYQMMERICSSKNSAKTTPPRQNQIKEEGIGFEILVMHDTKEFLPIFVAYINSKNTARYILFNINVHTIT